MEPFLFQVITISYEVEDEMIDEKEGRKRCKEKLEWKPILYKKGYFTESYPVEECYLRMNDFPGEPMWTLFYKGESIDFDDEPKNWKVKYRGEM